MPPIVHLVRHAQARSNVDAAFRNVLDPELTQAGIEQARDLSLGFPFHNEIKTVFSSPLQRALQTALLAFGENGTVGDKIVALPFAQETSDALCDTGRDPDALRGLFPESKIDYQYVVPGWNSKADIDANARATSLRDFLACQPEPELVLVTHGFFLHSLTEDWSELEKHGDWCGFRHCEYRTYSLQLVEGHYRLRETIASRSRRSA